MGVHSSNYIIKSKWKIHDWIRGGQRAQVNYMKKWLKCLWFPLLLHYFHPSSLYLWPYREFSTISWQGKRRLGPGLQMGLCNVQVPPKSGQLLQYGPFLGHPWRTMVKRNSPTGQKNLKLCICLFTLLGRRNDQTCDYILIHGLWPMVWLDGQGLGRNMNGKLVTRQFGEEACRQTTGTRKNVKILVSPVTAH